MTPNVFGSAVGVDVIVPSTCEARRRPLLLRALASVVAQDELATVVLVANGPHVDTNLLQELQRNFPLRSLQLQEGNVSRARYAGVLAGRGEFFCFLDDDDELLPDSLALRVQALETEPGVHVAVCNGYLHTDIDNLLVSPELVQVIDRSPFTAFLEVNWFASPAAMFRRALLDRTVFDLDLKHYELTYLFCRLASTGARFRFVDRAGYRVHMGSPESASKSEAHVIALPAVLEEIAKLPLDASARQAIRRKYAAAVHSVSDYYLSRNDLAGALRYYVKCLGAGGFRYALAGRRIAAMALQQLTAIGRNA